MPVSNSFRVLCLSCSLIFPASSQAVGNSGLEAAQGDAVQREEFLPLSEASQPVTLLRAEQIKMGSLDSFPREGPDSIAGLGDWWLSNGKICVAVSDIAHDAGIVAGGGTLVDVAHCDRGNDQWTYANILTGLAKETAIPVSKISTAIDDGLAEIITVGEADGLRQTVSYSLQENSDTRY
jgi:hypothetical protein